MTMYKCDRCGIFCSDQGSFEFEYFDDTVKLIGARISFEGNLCADCCKSAMDVMKSFLMKESED